MYGVNGNFVKYYLLETPSESNTILTQKNGTDTSVGLFHGRSLVEKNESLFRDIFRSFTHYSTANSFTDVGNFGKKSPNFQRVQESKAVKFNQGYFIDENTV